ncbi:DUF4199 domain-containing protein [Hymenobacter sp. B81]|uniref:DUF4199 domain-containing protein n=1 Tax=Hymenobacter sp. B81 TaxID=3344878 RepID=UPI0037DD191C
MKNNSVIRTALLFGAGAGLLSVVWWLFLYWTGQNPYGPKRLMTLFWPPLAVLLSQWYVRRYFPENGPGLGKAVLTGVLTTVIAAVVSAAGVYGLARLAGPGLIAENRAQMEKMLAAEKPYYLKLKNGALLYEANRQGIADSPRDLAMDDWQKKLVVGLILSIPGGVFFRK